MARHGGGSFAASGTPSFVAGATLGNAIGESIRAQQDFNDCMEASGWEIADQSDAQKKRVAELKEKIQPIIAQGKACMSAVREEASFSAISSHFGDVATGKFSMAQLADTTVPTPGDAALMARYYDETTSCRRVMADSIAQLVPQTEPIFQKAMSEQETITKPLVMRQISWGDFASKTEALNEATSAELNKVRF
jgi:hypothetical protein